MTKKSSKPKKETKKSSPPKEETRTDFMFPELHGDVVKAVSHSVASPWFCESDSDNYANNEYPTHVIGKFRGREKACCSKGWRSLNVAILIRGYSDNGYNALVFNQRCKTCNQLGTLTLDKKSYVERVARRIQIWAGVPVQPVPFNSKRGKPHEREFCEGCKKGVCRAVERL